jgi:ABC-type Fe3+-hydroxamate transport system substrate-binding protein
MVMKIAPRLTTVDPSLAHPPRIASLVPSVTELLAALGLADHLVARTGYCVHPAGELRNVPKVGGTKEVNLLKLRRLKPTHVLVNIDENRIDTVARIRAWGIDAPRIVVTHPLGPRDNLVLVQQMAREFGHVDGVRDRAAALIKALRGELALTRPDARAPLLVLYLIWHAPWMTVARDTYLSRMLAQVNWQTLPPGEGGASGAARYPVVSGDEPWLADVQRVLLSSEPFAFQADHAALAQTLCPNAGVQFVDGELLSWYGARAVPGLRYLRELAAGLNER